MRRTRVGWMARLLAWQAACMAATAIAGLGCAKASERGDGSGVEAVADTAETADAENPHVWKPRTKSVAVFKNGLGFFMREGDVLVRDGWCVADKVPPAAFGTLAVYSISEKGTVDIVGSGPGETVEFDGRDASKDVAAKQARLESVKNLRVELRYKQKGQERTAAGRLVSVSPEFVVLETEANSFAVPLPGITRLQVLDLPLRIHVAGEEKKKARLGMAYLRKGITWIPDYTLKILDEQTAELTLRGTLVNEAEDLIHTDVNLVVGVPHFTHTEYLAPIAVGQAIRTIGSAVAAGVPAGVPSQVTTQIMNRAAIVSNAMTAPQLNAGAGVVEPVVDTVGDLNKAIGNLPQLGGAAATDYTVYTKKDLTLRRGEKAIVTLFTKKIAYGHIYRWSPPTAMEHSLVLINGTDTAWTTGPCLALSADNPLTEDLLKYTPKSGRCELPVTHAINIAHEKSEREIDRKLKAYSPNSNNSFYDLVTLEGKMQIRNFEKRTVDVVISNPVFGKPIGADVKGAISGDATKLKLLDREGRIDWTLKLEPGEEKTLTYQYERYVPSN